MNISGDVTVVRRSKVEKKDEAVEALYNSSHAVECVWIAHLLGNSLYFTLASDTGRYLKAVPNRVNVSEYMLVASQGKPADGAHLFDSHSIERRNGVKITAMESLLYPNIFSHMKALYPKATQLN